MLHTAHLPNSRPGEKTVLFLRRHWVGVVKLVAITLTAAIAPVLVQFMLGYVAPAALAAPAADAISAVFLSIYYLAIITFFFQEFIDYYLDTWIVTTERIINIEQHGLFQRVASEMHLPLVQDSSAEIKGALHTFLDYGDVHIQSAGEAKRFHFKNVAHPERVRVTILRLAENDRLREEHKPPSHIIGN
ncbi:MAG TPA: PH domain-containing protein [Patescibacteria group bacterium]|nr:PH domain-containing protein [Patescibacteria group bacterium]